MKSRKSFLFVLIVWGPFATVAAPRLVVPEPVFDFGAVPNVGKVDHRFLLRNSGTEPLEIRGIDTSCGCTVANAPDQIIEPGRETYVDARFFLQGYIGVQSNTLTITSNDPDTPTFDLVLTGIALQTLEINPPMLSLGRIPPNDRVHTRELSVTTPEPFAITKIEVDSKSIHIEPSFKLASERWDFAFVVKIDPARWDGLVRHAITLHTTSAEHPTLEIPVVAYVTENPY